MQATMITALTGAQPETAQKGVPSRSTGEEGEGTSFFAVFEDGETDTSALTALEDGLEDAALENSALPTVNLSDAEETQEQDALLVEVPEQDTDFEQIFQAQGENEDSPAPVAETVASLTESVVLLQTGSDRLKLAPEAETVEAPRLKGAEQPVAPNPGTIGLVQQSTPAQTASPEKTAIATVAMPKTDQKTDARIMRDIPVLTETANTQTAAQAMTAAPVVQKAVGTQVFQLEPKPSRNSEPRFELSWPAASEARATTAQAPVTQVQIQPAQPLATPNMASLIVEKDKTLQFDSSRIIGEASLDFSTQSEGPRESRQSIAQLVSTVATRADLPVNVARQIAEAVQRAPGKSVELQLHPAELGRVRMTLSAAENGMTVLIQTERNETLDLMRRNIEVLEQAIGELGYSTINFSFGPDNQQSQGGDPESNPKGSATTLAIPQEPTESISDYEHQIRPAVGSVIGMDVKV